MSDKITSDPERPDLAQSSATGAPGANGIPAWLDELDLPAEAPPLPGENTPIAVGGAGPTPLPKPDSWPDLVNLPPSSAEVASWPELRLAPAEDPDDFSEVNLGQNARQRPPAPKPVVAADLSGVVLLGEPPPRPQSETDDSQDTVNPSEVSGIIRSNPPTLLLPEPVTDPGPHAGPDGAESSTAATTEYPAVEHDPTFGLIITKDEFAGLSRLSRNREPVRESADSRQPAPPESAEPPADGGMRTLIAAELHGLVPEPPAEKGTNPEIDIAPVAQMPAEPHAPPGDPASASAGVGRAEDTPRPQAGIEVESIPISQLFRRGQPVVYGMAVRNTNPDPLYQMRVEHDLPEGPRFVSADPVPEIRDRTLIWSLGTLEPGSKQRIQVTVQPNHPTEIPEDAVALFRIYQCVHSRTRVLKPALSATLTLPERVSVGEAIPLTVVAQNKGAGAANNLEFIVPLPSGLLHGEGSGALEFKAERLGAGGTCRFEAYLTANRAGNFTLQVEANGAHKLRAASQATVTVLAPELHIRMAGPPTGSAGLPFECQIDVSNLGDAPATAVQTVLVLPDGIDLAEADGGAFDAERQCVTWLADTLAPQETVRHAAMLIARDAGSFGLRAEAWDRCSQEVATTKTVTIEAAIDPALDLADDDWDGLTQSDNDSHREQPHVLFTLAGTDYAVPVAGVVEIGRPTPSTPIPNMPDWLIGVTSSGGDIVPVVDLRRFLGLGRSENGQRNRVLLVRSADVAAGLLVDRVAGIRSLATHADSRPAPVGLDRVRPFVQGVAQHTGRPVVCLNLDRLLLSPEMRQFA